MLIHAYRIRDMLVASLCVLCIVCSSCIVVPAKSFNKVIVDEDTLASIEVGRDTRASLAQLLGAPLLRSPDDSRWIYRARVYNPTTSQLCVPAYQSFDCQQLGVTHHEFLDARFALDGTLEHLETVVADDDESGCTSSGVCFSLWPRALALYADPNSRDRPGPRRFWAISQNELMDSLRWSNEERGWSDEEMTKAPWASIDVDCGPGEVRYFEFGYARGGKQQILEVEDVRGKQEIAKRRKLISMYAGEYPYLQPVTPSMKP